MPAPPYRNPLPPEPEPPPPPPDVGALLSTHVPRPLYKDLVRPVAMAAVVVGVACVVWEAPLSIAAPLGAVLLAVLAYNPIRLRNASVELHAGGLVFCKAGARRIVPFSEVNEVWYELARIDDRAGARLRSLRIVDFGGAVHHVPLAFEGATTCVQAVLREASAPLLAEARQALREGAKLTFGRVQLDREGIARGKKRLEWRSIRLVVFQRRKVFFYRRWPIVSALTVRIDRIPNPTVLAGLVTSCAPNVRVDDRILVPFASEAEALRAMAAAGAVLPQRSMLNGGFWLLAGLGITWFSYARHSDTYTVAYGAVLYGAYQLLRGLVAYLSGPRR